MQLDSEKNYMPIGTRLSGYVANFTRPGQGSGCWNCIHLDAGFPVHCDHPAVKADFDVQHVDGKAVVVLGGCCTYIRRKGDK